MRWKRLLYLDRTAQVFVRAMFCCQENGMVSLARKVGWLPTLTRRNPKELGPRHVVEDQFRFAYPVDLLILAKKENHDSRAYINPGTVSKLRYDMFIFLS
jgi:hypothetical protein